jgi:hypothetical protein
MLALPRLARSVRLSTDQTGVPSRRISRLSISTSQVLLTVRHDFLLLAVHHTHSHIQYQATHLGLHYMKQSKSQVKALILLGSMGEHDFSFAIYAHEMIEPPCDSQLHGKPWSAAPSIVLPSTRSLASLARSTLTPSSLASASGSSTPGSPVRMASLPFSCAWDDLTIIASGQSTATNIIQDQGELLTDMPLTPVSRIAGAIFLAATDRDWRTSGCVYMLPDERLLLLLDRERLTEGVYRLIDEKIKRQYRYAFASCCPYVSGSLTRLCVGRRMQRASCSLEINPLLLLYPC